MNFKFPAIFFTSKTTAKEGVRNKASISRMDLTKKTGQSPVSFNSIISF